MSKPVARTRRCLNRKCRANFVVLIWDEGTGRHLEMNNALHYDADPEFGVPAPCHRCGGLDSVRVFDTPTPVNLGGEAGVGRDYPRFDRGLGMWVKNHAHRTQICRDKGLVPLEGGGLDALIDQEERRTTRAEGAIAEMNAIQKQYQEDPVYKKSYYTMLERPDAVDNSPTDTGYQPASSSAGQPGS